MRQYELILVVQPDLDDETTAGVIDRVKTMITDHDGQIIKTDLWGSKALAYEIRDFREGYYVYMVAELTPEYVTELKQSLKYIETMLRYIITKKDE